jgi:hypothetical protein
MENSVLWTPVPGSYKAVGLGLEILMAQHYSLHIQEHAEKRE